MRSTLPRWWAHGWSGAGPASRRRSERHDGHMRSARATSCHSTSAAPEPLHALPRCIGRPPGPGPPFDPGLTLAASKYHTAHLERFRVNRNRAGLANRVTDGIRRSLVGLTGDEDDVAARHGLFARPSRSCVGLL